MTRTRRLTVVLVLNLGLVAALVITGATAHSVAVLAEGGDYLLDAAGVAVALLAIRVAARSSGRARAHGRPAATDLAALFNGGWLLLLEVLVAATATGRLVTGTPEVHGLPVLVVSGVAALVMTAGALVLGGDADDADDAAEGRDLSVAAVMLDTVADAAAAAGVAATGGIILAVGGWYWLDPAVALVIAVVIGYHAVVLLREVAARLRSSSRRGRGSSLSTYDGAVDDTGADAAEIPLAGGDVTEGVVRIGATVHRPTGPHSPLVHALLTHLESAGFDGAPRFLGIDASGREVLSYVDGEVAGRPRPPWIADETRLASIGRLVRAYDDAAASFTPPPDALPAVRIPETPGIPPAPPYPPELIGHLDFTPENIVFRDGLACALIDFDLAKPATRADEMFNAMLWWAPLSDPRDADPLLQQVDVPRRARILADSYGLSGTDRERIMEVAVLRTRRSWHVMKQHAETRGGGWQRMWDEGVGDVIKRREAWLDRHAAELTTALTAP